MHTSISNWLKEIYQRASEGDCVEERERGRIRSRNWHCSYCNCCVNQFDIHSFRIEFLVPNQIHFLSTFTLRPIAHFDARKNATHSQYSICIRRKYITQMLVLFNFCTLRWLECRHKVHNGHVALHLLYCLLLHFLRRFCFCALWHTHEPG